MEEKKENSRLLRIALTGFSVLFLALIALSIFRGNPVTGVQSFIQAAIMPVQKGINTTGSTLVDIANNVQALKDAQAENAALKERVEELEQQINLLQMDTYELDSYRELLSLTNKYSDYEMIGANVIAKDSGNWFNSFVIDKGSNDGVTADMAVLAQGGLAGIVTAVGPSSARVMAIIDDDSNITAMSMSTKDSCMISGDLELYEDGRLRLLYADKNSSITKGDKIVTSNISTKYLPGILVGYVDEISVDSNNLTKSGTIIPYVNFQRLDTVLVITTLKNTGKDIEKH